MLIRAFLLGVTVLLPACSVYSTYEKCGFRGCPGDEAISAQVRDQFGRYPTLQPPNIIRVQTLDRIVCLTGEVDTDTERQLADELARHIPHVAGVVDTISLDYAGR